MPTVRLVVRYDGTGLSGWQRQHGVRTVQAELEQGIEAFTGAPAIVRGAGRTDAGVHALAQVAAFVTEAKIPQKGWLLGLGSKLPREVAISDAREVPEGFNPRHASAGKRYRYLVLGSRTRDPLMRDRAWLVHEPLDTEAMKTAAKALLGWHDFRAFRAADCERTSTTRCLFRVELTPDYAGVPGLLAVTIEGTAFLKNMVRILTGTLVDVGRGRLRPEVVSERLRDGDRTRSGVTAPAHGLYLDEVFLRPEHLQPGDVLRGRPAYAEALLATGAPRGFGASPALPAKDAQRTIDDAERESDE